MNHETSRVGNPALRPAFFAAAVLAALFSVSCAGTGRSTSGPSGAGQLPASAMNSPAVKSRNARIAQEAPGNYYIGRRWWTEGTRFWGYLRKPGQPWSTARLVIMNESITKQPDRISEEGQGQRHGYDHNYEYKIWGSYTGDTVYDPNSNFVIPEFRLSKFELTDTNAGFVFYPSERYSPGSLPPKHPPYR